jgi:hypothetical protein
MGILKIIKDAVMIIPAIVVVSTVTGPLALLANAGDGDNE